MVRSSSPETQGTRLYSCHRRRAEFVDRYLAGRVDLGLELLGFGHVALTRSTIRAS